MLGDSLYVDNLQEFVQDENRIVSYKWLSRKLDVPTDAAKRMLYAYVEHCRSSNTSVTVIYTITGLIDTEQGKSHRVCLVRGDELEATKKHFNPLRSVHIYSVQKSKLKDSSTLYTADYDIGKEHVNTYSRWSPIDCPVPTKPHPHSPSTTSSHITTHTHTHNTNKDPVAAGKEGGRSDTNNQKEFFEFRKLEGGRGGREERQREGEVKEESAISETEKNGTNEDKAKPAESKVAKPPLRKPEAKKGGKQKGAVRGSVASFFSKHTSTVKKEVATAAESAASSAVSATSPKNSTREDPSPVGGKNRRDKIKSSPVKAASRTGPSATPALVQEKKAGGWLKGLNDSDIDDGSDTEEEIVVPVQKKSRKDVVKKRDTESVAKVSKVPEQRKRKRIQNMSSDEEEDEGARQEGGRGSVAVPTGKGRKRVKRLKSKMYTTEDGAMVTEKVWESESTDESDVDTKSHDSRGGAKGSPAKVKPEQCSPGKGTRQALLMNFFKK